MSYGVRGAVGWVRHLSGSSSFLDDLPLPQSELEPRFPITEHLWLSARTPCQVTVCDTATIIESGDPWVGLDSFHRTILDYVAAVQAREEQGRRDELARSIARERALFESVKVQLAVAANRGELTAAGPLDDALVSACRMVGEVAGFEVRAPRPARSAAPAESRDRLGELARAVGNSSARGHAQRTDGGAGRRRAAPLPFQRQRQVTRGRAAGEGEAALFTRTVRAARARRPPPAARPPSRSRARPQGPRVLPHPSRLTAPIPRPRPLQQSPAGLWPRGAAHALDGAIGRALRALASHCVGHLGRTR